MKNLGSRAAPIGCVLSVILDTEGLDPAEADAITAGVKQATTLPGHDEILVPGKPERLTRAERIAAVVPIDDTTWKQNTAAAQGWACRLAGLCRCRQHEIRHSCLLTVGLQPAQRQL
jgi:LDH2 family malate/lactate/ureidoglycolate dehydrogenase